MPIIRVSSDVGKPHSTKAGRKAESKRAVKRQFGTDKWDTHKEGMGKAKRRGRVRKFGHGRTNLLEELGRVEGERSNKNRRAEISRVHGELNKGYKGGKRVGLKHGSAQSHYLQHGYGPVKTKLRSGKPKIAIKGWS